MNEAKARCAALRCEELSDGIMGQGSFFEELLQDIADRVHDFLMSSSCRVSMMNFPIISTFSAMGSDLCLSRQCGMPRLPPIPGIPVMTLGSAVISG